MIFPAEAHEVGECLPRSNEIPALYASQLLYRQNYSLPFPTKNVAG